MSADHKRPLYAFVLVALLCALIIGNEFRSQAAYVGKILKADAGVVAGWTLDHHPADERVVRRPQALHRAPTEAPVEAAAPVAPAELPASAPATSGSTPVQVSAPSAPSSGPAPAVGRHHGRGVGLPAVRSAAHHDVRRLVHAVVHPVNAVRAAPGQVRHLLREVHTQLRNAGPERSHGHGLALGLLRHAAPHQGHGRSHQRGQAQGHGQGHGRGHAHGRSMAHGHGHGHGRH